MSGAKDVQVVLVDINAKMVSAWRETFEENPEVKIVQGSMLEQPVSAWVTPTNSGGSMDGGLDLVIKNKLGQQVQNAVQDAIKSEYGGKLPVGHATCVAANAKRAHPQYLISTPTMHSSSEDISDKLNTALACAGAFQKVYEYNSENPGCISSVALPGLGANTGRVPVEICADLMWTAYNLFIQGKLTDPTAARAALEEELGDLTPMGAAPSVSAPAKKVAKKASPAPKPAQSPIVKASSGLDEDFDDFE
jgi:O-acetyl-ADP-ribose deacetylase (regulator of RNase III)